MSLKRALKQRALDLGFCAVGVTGAERFAEAETAAGNRTQEGLMEGLSWWSEARAHASADPRRATPDARSVIALAFPHPSAQVVPSPLGGGGGRGALLADASPGMPSAATTTKYCSSGWCRCSPCCVSVVTWRRPMSTTAGCSTGR